MKAYKTTFEINGFEIKVEYTSYEERAKVELDEQLESLNSKITEKDISEFTKQIKNLLKEHYHIDTDI